MGTKCTSRCLLFTNTFFTKHAVRHIFRIPCNKIFTNEAEIHVPVKEIEIPVQWGHISGKLWGNENERPIVALHGWQDNAGTWDTLAPLLAKERPILAIEFPGHGLSTWIPPGMPYYTWNLPSFILHLKYHFKWDHISLLGHSMGSIASLRYACLYPEDVDFVIAVDHLIYDIEDANYRLEKLMKRIKRLHNLQTNFNKEPRAYHFDEMTKIWHLGSMKSISLDGIYILMKRGCKQSKHDPSKFYFSRDPRIKYTLLVPDSRVFVEALVKRLKCPTLYFKAIDSPYAADEFSVEMREVIANNNENFECHFVPGNHYVHLNNPEFLMPHITKFLQKHK